MACLWCYLLYSGLPAMASMALWYRHQGNLGTTHQWHPTRYTAMICGSWLPCHVVSSTCREIIRFMEQLCLAVTKASSLSKNHFRQKKTCHNDTATMSPSRLSNFKIFKQERQWCTLRPLSVCSSLINSDISARHGKTLSKLLDERCHYTEEVSGSLTS